MSMRKALVVLFLLVVVAMIMRNLDYGKSSDSRDDDSTAINEVALRKSNSISNERCLNDIRFANFTDKEWLDNEYIRSLRKYLDDYNRGMIKDKNLDPYKEIVRGKFVIESVEPYLLGGLFIRFLFIDNPDDIFSVCVYSSVDMETEKILDYSVRGILHNDEKSGFTKDEVQRLLKEHPEQKVW